VDSGLRQDRGQVFHKSILQLRADFQAGILSIRTLRQFE
jgi:hypothetical protein